MKIVYEDGPEKVNMGAAGSFIRGEPKEIADNLAETLLQKQSIKFKKLEEKTSRKREV